MKKKAAVVLGKAAQLANVFESADDEPEEKTTKKGTDLTNTPTPTAQARTAC